jgi:hypothetical protein
MIKVVYDYWRGVGKCPRGFSLETAQRPLEDAIKEYRSRQPDVPFRLWNYHDGAVYRVHTSVT